MTKLATIVLASMVVFLVVGPVTVSAQPTSISMSINVYGDGSAAVSQVISANSSDVSINVRLLSSVLSDVVAVDQNGSPLSYQISGTNITIYTLGSIGITLRYDTDALTDKQGTVWMLNFSTSYNATLILPPESMVTSVSGTPASFSEQGGSPVIVLAPGEWQIDYGIPISVSSLSGASTSGYYTSSGSASSSQASIVSGSQAGSGSSAPSPLVESGVLAVIMAAALTALVLSRRRKVVDLNGADLRPDDIQVLNYIVEKGGRVFEPEIRTRFALPKTSGWRQIKRLERLGYIKITKVGSQNQVEVIKNRERQAES